MSLFLMILCAVVCAFAGIGYVLFVELYSWFPGANPDFCKKYGTNQKKGTALAFGCGMPFLIMMISAAIESANIYACMFVFGIIFAIIFFIVHSKSKKINESSKIFKILGVLCILISILGMRNKLSVLINWIWAYCTYSTSLRLLFQLSKYPKKGRIE